MKKYLILILALPFVLSACNKTDEPSSSGGPASASATALSVPTGTPSDAPASPSASTAPGGSATKEQVVGTWKVDLEKSTIKAPTDKEKTDLSAMRFEVKADGTFTTTGSPSDAGSGKWTLEGDKIKLQSDKGSAPPELTVAADGSTLSMGSPDGKEMMVMVKA